MKIISFFACLAFSLIQISAQASTDLDRQFQLETIGLLKSWDNVDGLFAEYVAAAYKEFFSHQSRFVVNDLTKADTILSASKLPYTKVIEDPEILSQLARSTRSESIIRTRIIKEGHKYFFTLDWMHSPTMELMSTVNFNIEESTDTTPFGTDFISEALDANLNKLLGQIPLLGNVTGRDNKSVTINLGYNANIKKGDILVIGTLDEVKKHPLLKSIVDWRLSPVGKVIIEQTEESMSFAKIIEEEPGREIARQQKVTQIQRAPLNTAVQVIDQEAEDLRKKEELPKVGWVGASLILGSYNYQYSSVVPVSNTGGGVDFGAKVEAQIWFTKEWFTDLMYGFSLWNFSQQDVPSGKKSAASLGGGVGGSMTMFHFDIGYSYLVTGEFLGPKGWLKLGFKSTSFSLPQSAIENTGSTSFGTIFLGLGGELPVRGNWGALTNLNLKIFTFVSQNWITDSGSGASDLEFTLGGYYRLTPRMTIRATFDIMATGADFSTGTNVSQKTITFGPSLLYYF
jgi:hypothetical protein